jgi:STAM-binding protein
MLMCSLVLKELPKHPEYKNNGATMAPLRGNLVQVLDILEAGKLVLLARFREAEAEQGRLEARQRELDAARRREEEARILAERAVKGQEEARRQRIIEMQKLDMANRLSKSTTDLSASLSGEIATPVMTPLPAPTSISPPVSLTSAPPTILTDAKPIVKSQFVLENGMPLRKVMIPQCIVQQFLDLAAYNTRQNLETCGVLAGKLSHDIFTITTLMMPKQTATSDTVSMLNEEEIFDVQDKKELLTLGWIHTHPTQQCFMSSVDLHTHFPYQLLMAEAIAIVVAPTQSPKYIE